jgi:UbiD family decarboxylase
VDARASNWGNDLRDFVDRLERNNDLKTFSNADWNLEIGALTEIGAEQNGPALMFDKIKGYPRASASSPTSCRRRSAPPLRLVFRPSYGA